jgi:hypothetical protein
VSVERLAAPRAVSWECPALSAFRPRAGWDHGLPGFGPDSEANDFSGLLSAGLSEALNRHQEMPVFIGFLAAPRVDMPES